MALYEIVYQSFSIEDYSIVELNELMVLSRVSNKAIGVTGCLIYHERTFIQVLEGQQNIVKQLYSKIKNDRRHSKVDIIWEGEIEERGFSGWSMSMFNLGEKRFNLIFSNFLDSGKLDYDVKGIMTTSKALLKELKDDI